MLQRMGWVGFSMLAEACEGVVFSFVMGQRWSGFSALNDTLYVIHSSMPKIRHAHHRYEILDELLRKSYSSPMTLAEITEKLNLALEEKIKEGADFEPVKSRTIRQDFEVMRKTFNVDIRVERRHEKPAYYMYDSPFRSIHHGGLSPTEADDVRDMLHKLQRFLSHEQLQFLHQGVKNTSPIESLFRLFLGKELNLKRFLDGATTILFDSAIQLYEGDKHIEDLAGAIQGQNILSINYQSFKGTAKVIDFHPYVLKQYNNRWFCYGYNPATFEEGHGPYQTLALDRIHQINHLSESDLKAREKLKRLSGTFRASPIRDWENDVFAHVVGVSIDSKTWLDDGRLPKAPTVEVAFHPEQVGYEETKPLHHTRKYSKNHFPELPDGWVVMSYRLFPNVEFEQQLLMRGSKAMVMSPPDLAQRVREKHKSAYDNYELLSGESERHKE